MALPIWDETKKTVLVVVSLALSVTRSSLYLCKFRMEKYDPPRPAPILSSARPTISVTTQQMNSSRQNRSERSQQTQSPGLSGIDMLCETRISLMTEDSAAGLRKVIKCRGADCCGI